MANVIIYQRHWQRRGTSVALTAANEVLYSAEFCYETDTGKLKIGDGVTAWNSLAYLPTDASTLSYDNSASGLSSNNAQDAIDELAATSGALADGDYGDIIASTDSNGAHLTVDNGAITYAKIQDVTAQFRVLGRNSVGAGDVQEVTFTQLLDWVGSSADGDILYRSSGAWTRLPVGTNGNVLTLASGLPTWAASSGSLTNWTEAVSTASPNATVPVVSFTATNAATNVDAAIKPKGNGAVLAAIPDSTSTGGNKRGTNAVDLQTKRGFASGVASGNSSVICGGDSNTASGFQSVVCGGGTNTASASGSSVLGGDSNQATAQSSTVTGGSSNLADALYARAGGGASTTRGIHGADSFACGLFSAVGDAQIRNFILRSDTTNATPEAMTGNNQTAATTNQIVLPNSSAFLVRGDIIARQNTTGDTKSWEIRATIKRGANAAATALVGTAVVTVADNDAGAAAWAVAVTADTTNGCLKIQVTGEASKTIRWVGRFTAVEEVG